MILNSDAIDYIAFANLLSIRPTVNSLSTNRYQSRNRKNNQKNPCNHLHYRQHKPVTLATLLAYKFVHIVAIKSAKNAN